MMTQMQHLLGNSQHLRIVQRFTLLAFLASVRLAEATGNIGVNYGTLGNNLPAPAQVAQLILTSTTIRNVKIYNPDQAIMQAFANTNIKLIVGVPTETIPALATSASTAQSWIQTNIAAYTPATQVTLLAVGNEVFTTSPHLAAQLVPAMANLHTALVTLKLETQVKVGTPQNLQVLATSYPPSSGAIRTNITTEVKSLLSFLSTTGGPLMVNIYPYFAHRDDPGNVSLEFALLQPDVGFTDVNTGLRYTNMLDAQLDAVYSAMERLGFHNIPILVSETGWPSGGDPSEIAVTPANAQTYNQNLIKYVTANKGTPLRPGTMVDAYIFALFNENMKSGLSSERFFGLFNADKTAVYNLGLLTTTNPPMVTSPPYPAPIVVPAPPANIYPPPITVPSPVVYPPPAPPVPTVIFPPPVPVTTPTTENAGKTWCVAKAGSGEADVTNALRFACSEGGADCGAIQAGGACYNPNTLLSHASVAFNVYYQKMGRNYWNCYFGGTGVITITDPSYSGCSFH